MFRDWIGLSSKFSPPKDPSKIETRTQLLNYLASTHGYIRYLEIGVRNPKANFEHVRCAEKYGVDPAAQCTHPMTSDEFFAQAEPSLAFDLVFIDGLHLAEQVEKDVNNALRHLSANGTIVLHDCNPLSASAQSETYQVGQHWNGTVWKAIAKFRATRPDLFVCVIDIDEGCGVIHVGQQECYSPWPPPALDYTYLDRNRRKLLNLISMNEFVEHLRQRLAHYRTP